VTQTTEFVAGSRAGTHRPSQSQRPRRQQIRFRLLPAACVSFASMALACGGSDAHAARALDSMSTRQVAQAEPSDRGNTPGRLRPSGTELIPNGSFDTDVEGWTAFGGFPGPTLVRDTTVSRTGRASMRVESPNASLGEGAYSEALRVAADRRYSLGVWLKAPVGTRLRVSLDWKDASFQFISSSSAERTARTTDWFRIEVLRTPPRRAAYATVVLREREPRGGELVFYADDLSLQEVVREPPALSFASDFGLTPLVSNAVRGYVESKSDLDRSTLIGLIIVPLVLVILLARELLIAGGRTETRTLAAYAVPLIACFVILIYVRLKAYVG
jgi:hypothetical protein